MSEDKWASRLNEIIAESSWFDTLKSIKSLNLPECWLAGGAIRNTVWKVLYGDECSLTIKDLDVLFYDINSERPFEKAHKKILEDLHPQWVFDVKNQRSFGRWRDWDFQFNDSKDGITHFLHTATAVGVRLDDNEKLEFYTPYGLDDLFQGIVRVTPFQHSAEAAIKRHKEFREKCPALKFVHDENVGLV